jgi:glutathione peroxidase
MTTSESSADPTGDVLEVPIARLDGTPATARDIAGDKVALVVNVASRCGLTPQYAGLERLQERFGAAGLTVVGVPCNQFGGQEPGTSEEIATFCSVTYGVTFPLTEKVEVNGPGRHPLYARLVEVPDERGRSGDIGWNFEKFVVDRAGHVVARFAPTVEPEDERIVAVLEAAMRS